MTTLREMLEDFHDTISTIATYAPDAIPSFNSENYAQKRKFILSIWAEAKPRLKRDVDKAAKVDHHLAEGFAILDAYQAALDRGEKPDLAIREKGRNEFWAIYNSEPSKLR
jgi:flagellar assembly factor FliW